MGRKALFTVLLVGLFVSRTVLAKECGYPGDSPGRFGPYDYRDPTKDEERWLVEIAHFTVYMEDTALYGFSSRAQGGAEEAPGWQLVAGNLDYTLYAFPNHSRALYAMAIYQRRMEKEDPLTMQQWLTGTRLLPVDCYFQRAIGFAPDDPTVYHAYGAYLQKFGELTKATSQYEKAIELNPNAAEPRYNLGLLYFEVGDYEKASEQADRAYALGYPLPGLKNKLAAVRRAAN